MPSRREPTTITAPPPVTRTDRGPVTVHAPARVGGDGDGGRGNRWGAALDGGHGRRQSVVRAQIQRLLHQLPRPRIPGAECVRPPLPGERLPAPRGSGAGAA